LCETEFSVVDVMKTRYRSWMITEMDQRFALSLTTPQFDKLCAEKQAHPSH